jgi:HEAT repeat protein
MQPDSVDDLISSLDNPAWRVVHDAYAALVRIGPPVVPALIAVQQGENRLRKFHAFEILGDIGDRRAVELLLQMIQSPDPALVNGAIIALGQIKVAAATPALISVLKDGIYADWRSNAATALGKINDRGAIEALVLALHDDDSSVRCEAAQALGLMNLSEAIGPLVEVLDDVVERVRLCAAIELTTLLAEQPNHSAAARLQETVRVYTDQLSSADSQARVRAAYALGVIKSSYPVGSLIILLQSNSSDIDGSYAAFALGSIGDRRAVRPLIRALSTGADQTRRAAAGALGQIGDLDAVIPLQEALEDDYRDVRTEAGKSLTKIKNLRNR